MKTKKLNLKKLKIESFVTSLEGKDSQTIKGGITSSVLCGAILISVAYPVVAITIGVAVDYYVPLDPKAKKK